MKRPKPIPLTELNRRVKQMVQKEARPTIARAATENAMVHILQWLRSQLKPGAAIEEVPYKIVEQRVRRGLADVLRSEKPERKTHEVVHTVRTIAKQRKEALLSVAEKLGAQYLDVVRLVQQGNTLKQTAESLDLSPSRISNILTATKFHLTHFDNTGQLPGKTVPKVKSRRKAAKIVKKHFANLSPTLRSAYSRAAALGIDNALPRNAPEIHFLRLVVQKHPAAFPSEIIATFSKRRNRKIEPWLIEKLKTAAQRGDAAATTLLSRSNKNTGRYIDKLQRGKGIASRHPDLFIATPFPPLYIREINRESLGTHPHLVQQLAQRGEQAGIIMQMFLQGRKIPSIARELGIRKTLVKILLSHGAHVVFKIQPRGNQAIIKYEKMRHKHRDLFTTKKKRTQKN
ncbi:sigma-70 family RNA polymerase sigma factor [Candidatus Micrarchaeota archaeon]|nr:sigma-70 family RNA polymerase sigma factor [Candidatus Micrarchaeota archaeon]